MNILSLFGGMDTGRVALENIGYKIENSYYSEIKKHAIELTLYHNPDTISLGNINNWKSWDINWKSIDFIFSGSPCQDLSIAGKRAGLNGNKSSLFFVFVDILNHVKKLNPNVLFLQENVASATRKDIGIMSRALGIYPARINSELLTAQLRDRYYWTNIRVKPFGMFGDIQSDIPTPKDLGIFANDILTSGKIYRKKLLAILERESGIRKNNDSIIKRIESGNSMENYIIDNYKYRPLNKIELCRAQGFPDNYCEILTRNKAASLIGDGWTLPVIEYILKFI